jgi:TonB family protein
MIGQQLKPVIKKFPKSKAIQFEYWVIKKTKLKHGAFKKYFKNGQLNELGNYDNNQKHGTWEIYNEQGILRWMRYYDHGKLLRDAKKGTWKEVGPNGKFYFFDYNLKIKIKPKIPLLVEYPSKARDQGLSGLVKIKVVLDGECKIKELKVVKSLGSDFDQEATKGVKAYIEKLSYYEDCINFNKIIDVNFVL